MAGPDYPNSRCLLTMLQGSWAAWLPGLDSPIQLGRDQLLALAGAADVVAPDVRAELRDQGLLLSDELLIEPPRCFTDALPDLGAVTLPLEFRRRYRLNRHIALQPRAGGFLAYSARHRCYVQFPVSAVIALTEIDEIDTDVPEAGESAQPLTAALEKFGFVMQREADKISVRKNAALAFASYAVGGAAKEFRKHVAADEPSNRVPVYFAGCIDLAMDMSYGYLNLALGMLMAYARSYEGGRLNDRYYLVPHFLLSPSAVVAAAKAYGPGVVFFSNYIWAHRGNLRAAKSLKAMDGRFVSVFGGPQSPSYPAAAEAMLTEHPYMDVLVRGEGEETAAELLDSLQWTAERKPDGSALSDVQGLTYRGLGGTKVVRTPDRPRVKDLAELPSPYLSGAFDTVPRQILYGATLETNRGCPYGCTFCDWGSATRQKIRKFEMDRVRGELDWIGRAGISVLFCADANFGILERDIEIAEMIAATAERHGALKQVVTNYAKNATSNLTEIIRIFARAGLASEGIISIQTRDAETLRVVNRSNIKTNRYDELLDVFRTERLPLSTDLMIGLPGATPESFKNDLQYYFETGVQAKAYLTRVLVNSPMADPEYRAKYEICTDEDGFIRSCSSFTERERNYMLDLFGMYSLTVGYGLLKYVLCYLQWSKGIQAMDFVEAFLREIKAEPGRYPRASWSLGFLDNQRHSIGGWRPLIEEAAAFAVRRYGVEWDSTMETVLQAQETVLADPDKETGNEVELQHDFVKYYRDGAVRKPLEEYGPGTLTARDPYGLCRMDPARHYQYDTHSVAWELASDLSDVDRPAFFLELEDIASQSWPKRTTIGQRAW